jgi:hypothetical protein
MNHCVALEEDGGWVFVARATKEVVAYGSYNAEHEFDVLVVSSNTVLTYPNAMIAFSMVNSKFRPQENVA